MVTGEHGEDVSDRLYTPPTPPWPTGNGHLPKGKDAEALEVATPVTAPPGGCLDTLSGSPWLLIPTAFLIHFITSGVSYSIGLYYVTFLEVFGETAALTSWVGSLNYAALCATGE